MHKSGKEKTTGKPLSSFSWLRCYFVLLTRPDTVKSAYSFLYTVTKNYLGLQFLKKWGFLRIPVVNVQTSVDDKIPFTPYRVHTYLHFVNFWLEPLSMLMTRFGIKKSVPYCTKFLDLIKKVYAEAGRIYRFRLSTTDRPDYNDMKEFRNIHRWDPHLLCVPSLHIAIIVLCCFYFRNLFASDEFTQEERDQWNGELYEGTVRIAESVLYIKQHSVHCVPAALYMMTRITPDLFTSDDAVKLINDMFVPSDDMSAQDKKEVNDYIHYMYERLFLEGCQEADWTVPVKHWLLEYAHKTGQEAAW